MIINVESLTVVLGLIFFFFFFVLVFMPSMSHLADVALPTRHKQRQEHGDERVQKNLVEGNWRGRLMPLWYSSVSGQGLLR